MEDEEEKPNNPVLPVAAPVAAGTAVPVAASASAAPSAAPEGESRSEESIALARYLQEEEDALDQDQMENE